MFFFYVIIFLFPSLNLAALIYRKEKTLDETSKQPRSQPVNGKFR